MTNLNVLCRLARVLAADVHVDGILKRLGTTVAPKWLRDHWLACAYAAQERARQTDDPMARALCYAEAGRYYAELSMSGAIDERRRHALNSSAMHTYTAGAIAHAVEAGS